MDFFNTSQYLDKNPKPFSKPIYVTRPLLPDLKDIFNLMKEVWQHQWLTNFGPKHELLESHLKTYLKVKHLSLFNNGTIALISALQALKIKGEVITTPFTFPATPHSLTWNGITPVFCDIDPITLNIDPSKIEALITPKTSAILAVHVYGTPCDVEAIQTIADRHGLKVIYDAAHAFGLEINGRSICEYGDISMLSFHSTKLFHTAEGGALVYNNPGLVEKIHLSRNFGIQGDSSILASGINGKMNEIQACIGLSVLKHVPQERQKRKKLIDAYRKKLAQIPGLQMMEPLDPDTIQPSYQYFAIRIHTDTYGLHRDQVMEKLKQYNVFARRYFYPLCSSYPHYQDLPSSTPENLRVAQQVSEQVLCLPLYGKLTVSDVERICTCLKMFQTNNYTKELPIEEKSPAPHPSKEIALR